MNRSCGLVLVSGVENRYSLLNANNLAKRPTLTPDEGGASEQTARWEDFWGTVLTCVGIRHGEIWSVHMDTWVHAMLYKLMCNELLIALEWCSKSSSFARFLASEHNMGGVSLPIEEDLISVPSPERAEGIEDYMDFL